MDSQMMDVNESMAGLIAEGFVEVTNSQEFPEGPSQGTSAGEEPVGEAPAPEATAGPTADAMADDEGHGTTEVEWLEQISKHLHHIENRLMEEGFLGHEVVRQIGNLIAGFSPPPRGDWGWFLRRSQDIAVRTLRQLVHKYGRHHNEDVGLFEVRAMFVVRLYIEEAFHRELRDCPTPMRKAALCCFMVTMRNIEHHTLPQETAEKTKNNKNNKNCNHNHNNCIC